MLNPKEVRINESIPRLSFFSVLFVSPLPLGHEFQLILNLPDSLFPWNNVKGCKQSNSGLDHGNNVVLTMRHLILPGDDHKPWRGWLVEI